MRFTFFRIYDILIVPQENSSRGLWYRLSSAQMLIMAISANLIQWHPVSTSAVNAMILIVIQQTSLVAMVTIAFTVILYHLLQRCGPLGKVAVVHNAVGGQFFPLGSMQLSILRCVHGKGLRNPCHGEQAICSTIRGVLLEAYVSYKAISSF